MEFFDCVGLDCFDMLVFGDYFDVFDILWFVSVVNEFIVEGFVDFWGINNWCIEYM